MSDDVIQLAINENGVAEIYDDTYDIVIHCKSQEEQDDAVKALKESIPRDKLIQIRRECWEAGVNMTDEYQGVWVRYRDIEKVIDKALEEAPEAAVDSEEKNGEIE